MAEDIGYGQQTPYDTNDEYSVLNFIIRQIMATASIMKPVKVVAVHAGAGTPAAPPTVDVLPLVNQIDGGENSTPHGTVYGLPVFRLQAGNAAFIIDPVVDDVGFVICADRDISAVKASGGKQSNPGSGRKFDLADGIYVGGILGAAPEVYIWIKANGDLKIADGHGNVLETSSSGFSLTGNLAVTGTITATGEITRGLGGIDPVTLGQHLHTSGGTGSPTSKPTAGT